MNPFKFLARRDPMPDLAAWPGRIPTPPPTPDPEGTYRNPYPPPAGRRVRSEAGTVWMVHPDGLRIDGAIPETAPFAWGEILARGPVTLLPLTDEEAASEPLYGPVGARWGTPGTPCAYEGCALSVGHIGPHYDDDGATLGTTDKADRMYVDPPRGTMLSRICTCGNISQHQPGCARYVEPVELLAQVSPDLGNVVEAIEAAKATLGEPYEWGIGDHLDDQIHRPDLAAFCGQLVTVSLNPPEMTECGLPPEHDGPCVPHATWSSTTGDGTIPPAEPAATKRTARKTTPAAGGRKRAPRKGSAS